MNAITFRQKAKSVLLDNYGKRKRDGARSGRFLGRNLALLAAGSDRIFSVIEKRKYTAYAVVLLIDISGSMEGERLNYAVEAAYLIAKELKKLEIKVIIYGFQSFITSEVEKSVVDDQQALFNFLYKRSGGGTNETLAVETAHERLMAEREYPGKIIITMCDGEPGNVAFLKKAIKKSRHDGIETLSLGICSTSNKPIYGATQCATVVHPKHIYSATAGLLARNMRRA